MKEKFDAFDTVDASLEVSAALIPETKLKTDVIASRLEEIYSKEPDAKGLAEEDLASLQSAVRSTALSGTPVECQVRAIGSDRVFVAWKRRERDMLATVVTDLAGKPISRIDWPGRSRNMPRPSAAARSLGPNESRSRGAPRPR